MPAMSDVMEQHMFQHTAASDLAVAVRCRLLQASFCCRLSCCKRWRHAGKQTSRRCFPCSHMMMLDA